MATTECTREKVKMRILRFANTWWNSNECFDAQGNALASQCTICSLFTVCSRNKLYVWSTWRVPLRDFTSIQRAPERMLIITVRPWDNNFPYVEFFVFIQYFHSAFVKIVSNMTGVMKFYSFAIDAHFCTHITFVWSVQGILREIVSFQRKCPLHHN